MSGRVKVILDCDPGMDDSMAIVMAAKSSALQLMGVTTVAGNYPADVTTMNALKTLEMLGRTEVPVARGMDGPMVRPSPRDPFTHGADGQAEANLPEPTTRPIASHAVDFIIDTVRSHPREVAILATGPLSNVAMAMRKAPDIILLIREIAAISGAFGLNKHSFENATGDTPQSEWNVYVDPEAAKVVYGSGVNFLAIGLDVATHFDVDFTPAQLESFKTSEKKEARFLANAIDFVRRRGFDAYCTVIDCMAVAYAIDPSLLATFRGHVGVDTRDGLTLGMTVLDSRHHHRWEHMPEIRIAREADYGRFLTMLSNSTLGGEVRR